MSIFRGDASEIYALAADLSQVGAKAVPAMRGVMLEVGNATSELWKANARATSGAHGVHYPDAISAEMAFGVGAISVDVGPESGRPQGGMSFEFGSRNQPPHLDGSKALDAIAPRAEQMIESATGDLFP